MTELIENYNDRGNQIEIRKNEPMNRHTTFRIGGSAALFVVPSNEEELVRVCGFIREAGVRYYILGNGSNLLFDDDGFDGAVVYTGALSEISVDGNVISAGAGAQLVNVCKKAREHALSGMEFAYGIPGSVGGAVFMNAGAYGGEMSQVITESTYLDVCDLTIKRLPLEAHGYGYRESVYKHNNNIIISASFTLTEGDKTEISARMDDFMGRRIDKQPLEYPSAGSVFKRYPGRYTGQMIDEAGLRGYTIGGAQVSEKHAGFIVNRGGATAADVLALIEHIKKTILEKFGCELECEMIYVK